MEHNKKAVAPLLVGAALGAAAIAAVFSNKKNRDSFGEFVDEAKKKTKDISKQLEKTRTDLEKKATSVQNQTKKTLSSVSEGTNGTKRNQASFK